MSFITITTQIVGGRKKKSSAGFGSFLSNKSQSGQAIVEYVLLIIIIVAIAWIFARNFFGPIKNYGSQFFTSTIACALEYGDLPEKIKTEEGCEASFQAQSSGLGDSGSGGRGAGRNGKNGKEEGAAAKEKAAKENGKDGKSGGGKGSRSGGDSSFSGSGDNSGGSRGGGGSSGPTASRIVSSKGTKSIKSVSGDGGGGSGVTYEYDSDDEGGSGNRPNRRRRRYRPILGKMAQVLERENKKPATKEIKGKVNVEGGGTIGAGKKPRFKASNENLTKKVEEKKDSMDFSRFIRMALIILMVVAIVLFIFFQVSQIRKNSEG